MIALRSLVAVVAVSTAVLIGGAGVAVAAPAPTAPTSVVTTAGTTPLAIAPIGPWKDVITRQGGDPEPADLLFGPGKVRVKAYDGTVSIGTWKLLGIGRFSFTFSRPLLDDSGASIGTITVVYPSAVIAANGKTFTADGTATAYDPTGAMEFSLPIHSAATRG